MRLPTWALALPLLALPACADADAGPPDAAPQAGTVVDSILPPEEAMRRFTTGLGGPVAALAAGAPSAEAAVRRVLHAVAAADSAALEQALLTRAEFAYLHYPHHPQAAAPYSLSPQVLWTMREAQSYEGVLRIRARLGGELPPLRGVHCEAVAPAGEGRVHTGCAAALDTPEGVQSLPIGALLEVGGAYKVAALTP